MVESADVLTDVLARSCCTTDSTTFAIACCPAGAGWNGAGDSGWPKCPLDSPYKMAFR
jgi:hypothetical protein